MNKEIQFAISIMISIVLTSLNVLAQKSIESNVLDGNPTAQTYNNTSRLTCPVTIPVLEWQKSFGGSDLDYGRSIDQTMDGGYVVAGQAGSSDGDVTGFHGKTDFWVVKLDVLGNIEWQKAYGGSDRDGANSIQQTNDGGYIVAGYSSSNDGDVTGNHGNFDVWVIN